MIKRHCSYTRKSRARARHLRTRRKQRGGFQSFSDFKEQYLSDVSNIKSTNNNIFSDPDIIKIYDHIYNDSEVVHMYLFPKQIAPFIQKYYLVNTSETIDNNWIKQSNKYVEKLSERDKFMLRGYTFHGDEIVNTYLRNKDVVLSHRLLRVNHTKYGIAYAVQLFELHNTDMSDYYITMNGYITKAGYNAIAELLANTSDNDILICIERYISELTRIINYSPKLQKEIIVYRGVKTDYFESDEGKTVHNKGFLSTTISIDTLTYFSNYYIYRMHLNTNTPCVCLNGFSEHEEFEILVSPNTVSKIGNSSYIFNFDHEEIKDDMYALEDPFDVGIRRYRIRNIYVEAKAFGVNT